MGILSANFELGTFQINLLPNKVLFISSELLYQVNELWEMEIETVRKATIIIGSND
jgi:hypothetical protein